MLSIDSTFRPTWLVRVKDMKLVRGEEVQDEYWALSYSWNQSGEIIQIGDEEYRREDGGKHLIISARLRRKKCVKFEGMIQQMCKDFDIHYIWFDQRCINQDDADEKIREIKRMHLIYHHAACTLALVPELDCSSQRGNINAIVHAEWSKRIWTLEEAYMSQNILFLGRNTHLWSQTIRYDSFATDTAEYFIRNICAKSATWSASTALWYARTRTSSKAHDTIFALVNMFPDLKGRVTFGYKQPLVPLMIQFYGLLAEKDLSMLLFGAPIDPTQRRMWRKGDDLLPSWTGVHGIHVPQDAPDSGSVRDGFADYTVDKGAIRVRCTCISITIHSATRLDGSGDDYTEDGLPWRPVEAIYRNQPLHVTGESPSCLKFVSTTAGSQEKHNIPSKDYGLRGTHSLPLKETSGTSWVNTTSSPTRIGGWLSLTEDECSECMILAEICFDKTLPGFFISPVVMRTKHSHKAVGSCIYRQNLEFDSSLATKQTIVIE